jgi:hypothetical protein
VTYAHYWAVVTRLQQYHATTQLQHDLRDKLARYTPYEAVAGFDLGEWREFEARVAQALDGQLAELLALASDVESAAFVSAWMADEPLRVVLDDVEAPL